MVITAAIKVEFTGIWKIVVKATIIRTSCKRANIAEIPANTVNLIAM